MCSHVLCDVAVVERVRTLELGLTMWKSAFGRDFESFLISKIGTILRGGEEGGLDGFSCLILVEKVELQVQVSLTDQVG